MTTHKPGIKLGFLAKHRLQLVDVSQTTAELIIQELSELPHVDMAKMNPSRTVLSVHYEASHHNIDEVIDLLKKHGVNLKENWWVHFKLAWQRQVDENIRDNSKFEPHCCNKLPRGYYLKR
jgi:hypothetical protein